MKRPQVIRFAAFVTVLAVLLGYVVYHRTGPDSVAGSTRTTSKVATSKVNALQNYFVNYRMRRDRVMSQEISTLKSLLKNPSLSTKAKNQASATLVRDTQEMKQEMRIEGLLSGRGFPLTAAAVTQKLVVVQVGAQHLGNKQVAAIANVVTDVTNMPPEDVVIQQKS